MSWLRDIILAWLGLVEGPTAEEFNAPLIQIQEKINQLRLELDALKGEVRARNPQAHQVSLRTNVDDYEASQLKALAEFKEEK